MSIRKKVVWLPYDMDTAIGINNEGQLVFSYNLEDIDHIEGGADVFNGQDSVLWKNIRAAFSSELAAMYRQLRSTGALSYAKVEKMFEDHQDKWPEAIFNEDSWFKYIEPLTKDGNGSYLPMMQGSKAEQRKWWLYNRFRYIDSKYNAGDALSDLIQIRGYAKADVTVTPYADIYPSVKYGSYLVQTRGARNTPATLLCPLDNVNDTEIYIYSASQLASVGDLSGFKVGFADFSMATKLQSIKVGDSDANYDNQNLTALTLGNNVLLKTLDVRNCSGLGTGDQKTVDISGCEIIENVYFDGTAIAGVTLPNGGVLKKLHLPATITNLSILNQMAITDLTVASYANISTLRLENVPTLDTKTILQSVGAGTRVRLIGIAWEAQNATEIAGLLDLLDTMRGLDESGNNVETAQVSGTIHTTSLTGEQIASYNSRYPYITVTADYVESTLTCMSYDNETILATITCLNGTPQTAVPSAPAKPDSADGHYSYTAVGWNTRADQETNDPAATTNVIADRTIYPAYTKTVKTYTITWKSGTTTLRTDTNVAWGTTPTWGQAMPTKDGQTATGWDRDLTQPITGNTTINATYKPMYTATFVRGSADGGGTLLTAQFEEGATVTYTGATPTSTQGTAEDYPFEGWSPALGPIYANTTYTAQFGSPVQDTEITDTWDQIIANIDNGTYKTAYKIGNYKPLDLGTEGIINMQIVAMDEDDLAGGGKAPLTFIAKELLATKHMQSENNWGETTNPQYGMRAYLNATIKPLIPTAIASRIQKVTKNTRQAVGGDVLSTETLWIPSAREILGSRYEVSGVTYNKIYKDDASRKKAIVGGSYSMWFLRTTLTNNTNRYITIDTTGQNSNNTGNNQNGVCLGFCLGLEQETITDSWSEIFAAEQDGTYSTKYSIGDTKSIDLGTEDVHLMEIVAFDTDDRADGQGKAKITWISKDLLPTEHRMNATNTTVGGWASSEMRSYLGTTIKPLIPQTVRDAIVPVTKVSSTYTGGAVVVNGQTTTDDVWIPSNHEVFSTITTYESTGATYSGKFTDYTSRIKKKNGSATVWWTRSASSNDRFRNVRYDGKDYGNISANDYKGISLGFCT